MLAMKKELLISFSDIEAFCVQCSNSKCRSQIRLSVGAEPTFPDVQDVKSPVDCCVACGSDFSSMLRKRIQAMYLALRAMEGSPSLSIQVNADAIPSNQ